MKAAKELTECAALGPGWMREEVYRKSGASAGKTDVYYYSPTGERFRSKLRLVDATKKVMDLSNFNFRTGTMTGPWNNSPNYRKRPLTPDAKHKQPKKLKVMDSPTKPVPAQKPSSPIKRTPAVKHTHAVKHTQAIKHTQAVKHVHVKQRTLAKRTSPAKQKPAIKRTPTGQQNSVRKYTSPKTHTAAVAELRTTEHAAQRTNSQSSLAAQKEVVKQPYQVFTRFFVQPRLARIIVFKEVPILDKIKQLFQGGQMEGKSTVDIVGEVINAVHNPWLIQGVSSASSLDSLLVVVINSLCYCRLAAPARPPSQVGAAPPGHSGHPDHWPFIVTEDDIRRQEERVKQARRRLERALVADSFAAITVAVNTVAVNTVAVNTAAALPAVPAGALAVPTFAYPVVLSVAHPVANVGNWTGKAAGATAATTLPRLSVLPAAAPVAAHVGLPGAATSRGSLSLAPVAKTLTVASALPGAAGYRADQIIVPVTPCLISQVAAVSSVSSAIFPTVTFTSAMVTPSINNCKNSASKA
ncbi:uncharacterized protein LOC133354097 isoform X2 [Lethenteron reissneri]|uniref:uncharacterized protein LOC133354097 isoform X2 n=1 Tax=Lethenteron reissneri TaxID=7753 RepID=UPI002AB61732|nr:uncharacterized protein LOC133354097 isoform X2 [Lethenteron reissneri]